MVDYLCAKFGDFGLSRFGFYRADRHTQTESQNADDRYTDATTVVSNYIILN